jgi:transcriptional regulator with XRE-family HTH domain
MQTLARNLSALMQAHPTLRTQAGVARAAGVDQRTVGRVLNMEHAPSVAQLEKLAGAFHVEAWLLLLPELDPADLPAQVLTRSQAGAWTSLRIAAESIAKYGKDGRG